LLTRKDLMGPWAGFPVAWNSRQMFDEDKYREDLARTCAAGVPGIYTAGSAGEFFAMEFDEWQRISRVTVDICKQYNTPVMIGVTSTYTLGAERRAAYASEIGASAIQVALPYWHPLTDEELLPFFKSVSDACPGLAMTLYETECSKRTLSLEQHRMIHDITGSYLAVKATVNTIGLTEAGCRQLSEFINVWVGEHELSRLGPDGANGCASSLVYMNPRLMLHMFELLEQKKWDELQPWTNQIRKLFIEGLAPYFAKGLNDASVVRLMGIASGFLGMEIHSRQPYTSASMEDAVELRAWMEQHTPELLL